MCELLGMTFNLPIKPSIAFKGFRHRGNFNPSGWGLAYYPDKAVTIIKEPIKAGKSELAEFIQNYLGLKSRLFIGHVRSISVGSVSYKNTHPFSRELNGEEFTFAHNGTLRSFSEQLNLGRLKPIGETDSEYAFCYLLSLIERRIITNWKREDFRFIHNQLNRINGFGKFNCIFSNGTYLFCYHDNTGYKSLTYVERKAPFGIVKLEDEDIKINLAGEKKLEQSGFIIATRPLTNERWIKFAPGQLIVFKKGKLVFTSRI